MKLETKSVEIEKEKVLTISKSEFMDVVKDVINEITEQDTTRIKDPMLLLALGLSHAELCTRLIGRLFDKEEEEK